MSSNPIPILEVVLVGGALAVLAVCLMAVLWMNKPDPRITLVHGLMRDFPYEEAAQDLEAEEIEEPEDDESEPVPGSRIYDFFA